MISENITYGGDTAERFITKLLVDDGVTDRGHRTTLLSPEYTTFGIGIADHSLYGKVCVLEFASSYIDRES